MSFYCRLWFVIVLLSILLISKTINVVGQCTTPVSTTEGEIPSSPPTFQGASAEGYRVRLVWSPSAFATAYAVRYRQINTTAWTTATTNSTSTTLVRGMRAADVGKQFEWQVQATCPGSGTTAFSSPRTFSVTCADKMPLPGGTSFIPPAETRLGWAPLTDYYGDFNPITLQWRSAATATWTTVGNIFGFAYSHSLNGLTPDQQPYEWRIATQCPSGGLSDYSSPRSFTVQCPESAILNATTTTSTALLTWVTRGSATYRVEWRPSGTTTWANSLTASSGSATISGLSANTAYEARVVVICGSGQEATFPYVYSFSTPASQCTTAPTNTTEVGLNPMGMSLRWMGMLNVVSYRVRYREAGTSTWTSVTTPGSATSQSVSFTGNDYGKIIDWQVRASCSDDTSVYSPVRSFTVQCGVPRAVNSLVAATACRVGWSGPGLTTYTVRWRVNGSGGAWIESNPINIFDATNYEITGLSNGVTYEWQVGIRCGGGPPTAWSSSLTFTTGCTSTDLYVSNIEQDAAFLYWNERPLVDYQLEWRRAGTTTWSNVYVTRFNSLMVNMLDPGTAYEARVKVLCGSGIESAYSPIRSFTTTLAAADLSLSMQVSKRVPAIGETVSFSITVQNAGPRTVSDVIMISPLPPNMTFIDGPFETISYEAERVRADISFIPANQTRTVWFNARVDQPGTYLTGVQIVHASLPDPDSFIGSGTSDGDDDMAVVDIRTREGGGSTFTSPNPNPRVLPTVQLNQPAPASTEADLSLEVRPRLRTLRANSSTFIDFYVPNRGALSATGVQVEFTVPTSWTVGTGTGAVSLGAGTYRLPINGPILSGVFGTNAVPVTVAGSGEQYIRARIIAADQPDLDSPHTNGYGQGEDDEAMTSVRVR